MADRARVAAEPSGSPVRDSLRRRGRTVLRLVIASAACLLVAVALFEAIEDVLPDSSGSLMGAEPRSRWLVLREYPPNSRFWALPPKDVSPSRSGIHPGKHWVTTDSNGFIEPSRVHARADLTVVFVGGSTTEGLFVDPEHRFPYRVGRLLEDSLGLAVNSYNGGRSGNTTMHDLFVLIGKVVPLNLDYVVLMENVNDLVVLLYYESYWKAEGSRGLLEHPDLEDSAWSSLGRAARNLVRAVAPHTYLVAGRVKRRLEGGVARVGSGLPPAEDEFAAVRSRQHTIDEPALVGSYRRSLTSFVTLARIWGLAPVLMTQANRFRDTPDPALLRMWLGAHTGIPYATFNHLYHRLNDVTREVAAAEAVPLIDLDREMPSPDSLMYDAVHFNERGSEVVAKVISARMLEIVRAGRR